MHSFLSGICVDSTRAGRTRFSLYGYTAYMGTNDLLTNRVIISTHISWNHNRIGVHDISGSCMALHLEKN